MSGAGLLSGRGRRCAGFACGFATTAGDCDFVQRFNQHLFGDAIDRHEIGALGSVGTATARQLDVVSLAMQGDLEFIAA